ncbi:MAG TPA: DUF354 domain-containing protein, partial [Thermoplasmata archaeon]|nr:DUF354 domain-containing protein [Thermoplasmata archaeon]
HLEPFDGFKEDVYLADFVPDPVFASKLPARDYVVVRPEAVKAEYYPRGEPSIVPALLRALARESIPVVYLPRYLEDREMAAGIDGVWIPPTPLNGLDLCWSARAVLTGSGTMAREAALLGVPAVQFIPGHNLAVDRSLEAKGWLAHIRDPELIVDHLRRARRKEFDQARPRTVLEGIMDRVLEIVRAAPAA